MRCVRDATSASTACSERLSSLSRSAKWNISSSIADGALRVAIADMCDDGGGAVGVELIEHRGGALGARLLIAFLGAGLGAEAFLDRAQDGVERAARRGFRIGEIVDRFGAQLLRQAREHVGGETRRQLRQRHRDRLGALIAQHRGERFRASRARKSCATDRGENLVGVVLAICHHQRIFESRRRSAVSEDRKILPTEAICGRSAACPR